jgi:hypothetical protein
MKYLITYIKEDGFPDNIVIEASCGDEAMDKFESEYPEYALDLDSVERYSV